MILSLQTFTIRHQFQKESEIRSTCERIRTLGYRHLELAYIPWTLEHARLLKGILDENGLDATSSQIKITVIERHFEDIVAIHKLFGMSYISVSVIPFRHLFLGRYGLTKFAKRLQRLSDRLRAEGLTLLFHHHNYEFIRFHSVMALDWLLANLDPEKVGILSDTYWIRKGGFSVLTFLDRYKTHIRALHLRGHKNNENTNLEDADQDFGEILTYAIQQGFFYAAVEEDTEQVFPELEKSIHTIQRSHPDLLKEEYHV